MHGQSHGRDVRAIPGRTQAGRFAAQYDRSAAAQVSGSVDELGIRPGGDDRHVLVTQPLDCFGRCCFAHIRPKHGAQAGANRVWIEEVGSSVGDDNRIDARRIRASQDRTDIARLFHALQHGNDRPRRQTQVMQRAYRSLRYNDKSIVAVAER